MPSRSGVPGATSRNAAYSTSDRRCAKPSSQSELVQEATVVPDSTRDAARRATSATRHNAHAGDVRGRHRNDRLAESESECFGQAARRVRHLTHLAAEAELADDDRVGSTARPSARARDRERRPRGRRLVRRHARRPRRSRTRRARRGRCRPRSPSTATSIERRPPSNDCATRRGIGAPVSATKRLHLDAQRAACPPSPRKPPNRSRRRADRRGTARSDRRPAPTPSSVISMRPSSSVAPKRCFNARSMRNA